MKAILLLVSMAVLTFVLPTRSNAQCWSTQLVATECDSCGGSLYSKLICVANQPYGGTSCNIAASSYPCEDDDCYGVIVSAMTYGHCGNARPAPAGPSEEHPLAARHLIIFMPGPSGGYQEARLTVPGGPSPKTRFTSRPRIIFIPSSDGSYQDASIAAFSCASARGLRQ